MIQDVANIKHLARSYILLRHRHDELAEDLGRALDVGQRALADKELVASEKMALTRDFASLKRKMDTAEVELERLRGLEGDEYLTFNSRIEAYADIQATSKHVFWAWQAQKAYGVQCMNLPDKCASSTRQSAV